MLLLLGFHSVIFHVPLSHSAKVAIKQLVLWLEDAHLGAGFRTQRLKYLAPALCIQLTLAKSHIFWGFMYKMTNTMSFLGAIPNINSGKIVHLKMWYTVYTT